MTQRYSLPIPFGWFAVALSEEIAVGDVRPLRYFDRELVLFRTESGQARVLDAYCPHLGAHLGHGGTVAGESIACPFHGWQFNGAGECTSVPYADNMPPRAAKGAVIHNYPTREDNCAIWVWYHPDNLEPLWDLDTIDDMNDSEFWTESTLMEWNIGCHIQDTNENAVDKAHFAYVHGGQEVPEGDVTVEGHIRTTVLGSNAGKEGVKGSELEKNEFYSSEFITRSYGPGFTWQKFTSFAYTQMMGMVTPIDAESVHLRFLFKNPKPENDTDELFIQGYIDEVCRQVQQDIVIWNTKNYLESPILCDGDGPINQFRKWFAQFYAV